MSRREQVRALVLAALLIASTFSMVGATAAQSSPTTTFHVSQGDDCYEVSPIGDGDQTVEEFYDYRSGSGTLYGSYGEESQEIQENQVSHLFVYEGSEGLSLVMLHDELNESEGGAITFDISGLPEDREWATEDDSYQNPDDNFQHDGTQSTIDWMWADDRTDGAAVRGLSGDFDAITIDPAFGEESWAYQERDPQWPYATDDITDWEVESGDGSTYSLTKGEQVTIKKGGCDPTADLSASPNPAANNEEVTFDASDSYGGASDIEEFQWDFGDEETETTPSDTATVSHAYDSTGEYEASVTVVNANGDTATATTTVEVTESDDGGQTGLDAAFSASPETVGNDEEISFDASDSSGDIDSYAWDFGDGGSDSGETVTHSYGESGEYTVTLTVKDAAGNEDTTSETITVEDSSTDPPKDDPPKDDGLTADLSLSTNKADFGDKVGFDASASTDDDGIKEFRWNFDGDDEVDRTTDAKNARVYHDVHAIYDEAGTYTATVTIVDAEGNTDTASAELTVEQNDHTEPSATLHVPDTVEVGEEVELKATDFTGDESGLEHICWVIGDNHDKPDGAAATHTFETTGEKNVTLHLVDNAGNKNMLETTITVVEADDGGDKGGDDNGGDESPPDKGLDDDQNDGSTGGGIPAADPSGGSNDDSNDDSDDRKSAALKPDGDLGEVVVRSSDAGLTTNETAPADVRAPTAERDGFAALSYVTVSDVDGANATFTVSNERLEAANATPEAVSLFQFENDAWTEVETERLNATDDAHRFAANATNGTYAVGVDRPATAISGVQVADERVAPGDEVTVTASVANDGRAEGTHDVELTVDGEAVATESVSVPADSTREVEFTRSFDASGVYEVSVGDERAEVVVEGIETTEATTDAGPATADGSETTTDSNDGGVPGFGVGTALVALVAAALLARRQS